MLVPGASAVRDAHDLAQDIEDEIDQRLPGTVVNIHIEPLEDPRAWDDIPRGAEHPLYPATDRFGDEPA
jgi:divalent metal cation (Fe/Co/Zn/Cd) transporter